MRVLRYWRFGFGAALALSVGAALAQPAVPTFSECTRKPTPQDIEGAKGAHKAASQFYDRGDYDKAVRYWNDAYGFDCTANDLLINIANAYEKKGDRASAVATLEEYLKRTGPNPTIEQKVKNLKTLMAPQPPSTGTVPVPSATAVPSSTATTVPIAPTTAPTALPPAEGQRPYGNTPWFLVGGGGALAIVGAILLPIGAGAISSARSDPRCSIQSDGSHACPQDVADKGNTGRTQVGVGWGLLGVGLAAAGGGLVWQLVSNKPAPKPAPGPQQPAQNAGLWVTPVAGPGQTGMVLGGSF